MATSPVIPCIELPNPKSLKISLPFGGELKSILDISKGPPSDCTLIHGLMLQLAPALSGMECFLKVLNLVKAMTEEKPDPASYIAGIVKAAAKVGECLNFAVKLPCMIVDILKLIIAYLNCIVEAILSLLQFRVRINVNAAIGNPVLLASLNCAQNNAGTSMAQLNEALALVKPLFALIDPILQMTKDLPGPAGDVIKTIPDTVSLLTAILNDGGVSDGVPNVSEAVQKLTDVKSTLQRMQQLLETVPC